MYFDRDEEFTHVGLSKLNSRVESKWGQLGLYEHGLFEVPANYGDTVRYYKQLPYSMAIKLFYDFAAESGVSILREATRQFQLHYSLEQWRWL